MRNSRVLSGALIAGAVTLSSLFGATGASAAVLPTGQKIDIIEYFTGEYAEANPQTAAITPHGTPSVIGDFRVTGVDVDATGHGYAVGANYSEGPVDGVLFVADATLGTLTGGQTVSYTVDEVEYDADECLGIDFTNNVITASCVTVFGDDDALSVVGVVNPDTGVLVPSYASIFTESGPNWLRFLALAVDPISGVLYAATSGLAATLYTLSGSSATVVTPLQGIVLGADFDRGGQLWVTTESGLEGEIPTLATVNLVTGLFPFSAPFTQGGDVLENIIHAITIWGALPATGAADVLPAAAGAAGVLLLGAILAAGALVAGRRRSIEH